MAVIPVARMLFELGAPSTPVTTGLGEAVMTRRCVNCRSEDEVRAEVEEAHARGSAEGFERGRSERIQSEQQLRDGLADKQEALLSALAQEAIGRIDVGLERFRAETSRVVAQTLIAFFQCKVEGEAMEALSNELRRTLSENGATRVTIRGPQSLIDRLVELPGVAHAPGKFEVQASDAIDVTVNIDGTFLETTIGDWLAGLGRVL